MSGDEDGVPCLSSAGSSSAIGAEMDTDSDHDSQLSDNDDDNAGASSSNNNDNDCAEGGAKKAKKVRVGRPNLKDCDKLRIMFLFADTFRRDRECKSWKRAAEIVAETFSVEFGHHVAAESLRKVWRRLAKPVAEQEVIVRGGQRSKVTDEFKEQLIFILADPDIPAEQKSLRKIGQFLPDCPISRTTLRRVFKEVKKEQIVPKPPKPPRRRKPPVPQSMHMVPWNGRE